MRIQKWAKKLYDRVASGENEEDILYLDFLKLLIERSDNNKDAVIAVCGERGMGKSSFAIVCALILRQLGMSFEMENIFYGTHDLRPAVMKMTTSRRTIFVFDEMIDFAFSHDAMSMLNKNISKLLTKNRKMNNIYFLCIPRFKNLDSTIRTGIINFWIEVFWKSNAKEKDKQFAYAQFFRMDKNVCSDDPWGLENKDVRKIRAISGFEQLKIFKKINPRSQTFRFPPIPKPLEKQYEVLSRDGLRIAGDDFLSKISAKEAKEKPSETVR
jgi:hypothetical protein